MTTPPLEGLVQKEINGLTYWFDEATRKVHSAVNKAPGLVHAYQLAAAKPAVVEPAPAPPAPVETGVVTEAHPVA